MSEERLEKIEQMLENILERLERLENALSTQGSTTESLALKLTILFSLPAYKAIQAASTITRLLKSSSRSQLDDLDLLIIEILAVQEKSVTLRQLEKLVRQTRGKASRNTLARRVKNLEMLGIVRIKHEGNRILISLSNKTS